jgi:hypothetical protein
MVDNSYSVDNAQARVESRSYTLANGRVFQKAGVNITISRAFPRDLTKLGLDHPKLAATLKEVGGNISAYYYFIVVGY